jgi:hypothetical protein
LSTTKCTAVLFNEVKLLQLFEGTNCGIVISLSVSGFMASDVGWEYVFYLFGSTTILWLFFWAILISNSPDEHPTISVVWLMLIFTYIFFMD